MGQQYFCRSFDRLIEGGFFLCHQKYRLTAIGLSRNRTCVAVFTRFLTAMHTLNWYSFVFKIRRRLKLNCVYFGALSASQSQIRLMRTGLWSACTQVNCGPSGEVS